MRTRDVLKKTKTLILDTLFPIRCISCDADNVWLCEECLQKIDLLPFQVCPHCEKQITEKGKLCDNCKHGEYFLDNLVVAAKYKDGRLDKLVHLFKYNFIEDLHAPLARLLIKNILKNNLPIPDIILPVPLHKRRLRWRGFNQSGLLADYVSENLTPGLVIPVFSELVIRQKYTPPQMQIGKYSERRKNIENAFAISRGFASTETLKNKTVLLIDDIATTGATLNECAKVLKQNGARKVFGAVLARQEFSDSKAKL